MGQYSHLESAVNVKLPLNSNNKARDEASVRISNERVIVHEDAESGYFFSQSGDSGSWVFDRIGSLVGMIWGSSASSATYFTPIGLVVADIEERTRMKVELV